MERTFIIVKPEAVERGLIGEILHRFERKGFAIKRLEMTKIQPAVVEEHYGHHADKPFFPGLVQSLTAAPVVMAILEGPDVVQQVRNIVGATNPVSAAPGTIRGDFGRGLPDNLIHASDAPETAEEEIARFFGK